MAKKTNEVLQNKLEKIRQDFLHDVEKLSKDYHQGIKKILKTIDERKLSQLRKKLN